MVLAVWITDRTQNDIDYAKELNRKAISGEWTIAEQTEWLKGLKGSLSYTDFNRIESGMAEIANFFNVKISTKTDWVENGFLTQSDVQRWLDNCSAIRTFHSGKGQVLNPKMIGKIGFEDMNLMESFLSEVERISRDNQIYCSEPVCGGEFYYAYSL